MPGVRVSRSQAKHMRGKAELRWCLCLGGCVDAFPPPARHCLYSNCDVQAACYAPQRISGSDRQASSGTVNEADAGEWVLTVGHASAVDEQCLGWRLPIGWLMRRR